MPSYCRQSKAYAVDFVKGIKTASSPDLMPVLLWRLGGQHGREDGTNSLVPYKAS